MPTIATVEGIRVMMYFNDHAPAHFHALFAEHRAVIEIDTLTVRNGDLPTSKLRAILEWAAPRRPALRQAWDLIQARLPAWRIE